MIYVCVRQMSQPLSSSVSSSLWQPVANALIRLPADCRGEKKERNNRSSSPAWGPRVNHEGGCFHIHPALLSLLCPATRPDSYEGSESAAYIKPLVSRRINVSQWKTPRCQEGLSKRVNKLRVQRLSCMLRNQIHPCWGVLQAFEEIFMMWGNVYMSVMRFWVQISSDLCSTLNSPNWTLTAPVFTVRCIMLLWE